MPARLVEEILAPGSRRACVGLGAQRAGAAVSPSVYMRRCCCLGVYGRVLLWASADML